MSKQITIRASVLYDGSRRVENRTLTVEGTRIVDLRAKKGTADIEGWVTPAFIDAHSHIGMCREGEPGNEGESNDHIDQFQPTSNPLDSVYFDDRAFQDAVDFGVLYSCIVPGSGNLFAGRAMIIKNFARNRDEALLKDYGFKLALGYNPRSTTEWRGSRPSTRMGLYALLEKKFDAALQKKKKAELNRKKKLHELHRERASGQLSTQDYETALEIANQEYAIEFNAEDAAYSALLSGEKTAKVHVHKEDDALFLLDLAKRYNLSVTAEHLCDVHTRKIFDKFARQNIPIVYGPMGSLGYKVELKHARYQNASTLMQSNAQYGLMSDHPVVLSYTLRDQLKYFLIAGMPPAQAIGLITLENARILGIDKELGSIEKGKLASLIVWDADPLHLAARPLLVLAEGKVLRRAGK